MSDYGEVLPLAICKRENYINTPNGYKKYRNPMGGISEAEKLILVDRIVDYNSDTIIKSYIDGNCSQSEFKRVKISCKRLTKLVRDFHYKVNIGNGKMLMTIPKGSSIIKISDPCSSMNGLLGVRLPKETVEENE